MEGLLIIVVAGAAVISALTYPIRPMGTVVVSVITSIIGASALTLLVFGPKDYMLRIPSRLTTILHPYILGSFGILVLLLGVGGMIGISARWLMGRRISR